MFFFEVVVLFSQGVKGGYCLKRSLVGDGVVLKCIKVHFHYFLRERMLVLVESAKKVLRNERCGEPYPSCFKIYAGCNHQRLFVQHTECWRRRLESLAWVAKRLGEVDFMKETIS